MTIGTSSQLVGVACLSLSVQKSGWQGAGSTRSRRRGILAQATGAQKTRSARERSTGRLPAERSSRAAARSTPGRDAFPACNRGHRQGRPARSLAFDLVQLAFCISWPTDGLTVGTGKDPIAFRLETPALGTTLLRLFWFLDPIERVSRCRILILDFDPLVHRPNISAIPPGPHLSSCQAQAHACECQSRLFFLLARVARDLRDNWLHLGALLACTGTCLWVLSGRCDGSLMIRRSFLPKSLRRGTVG